MNKDYQHLFAQYNPNSNADSQNFQELHAENTSLRQQIMQLTNDLILQRRQWSEEHFKLTDKIEELQNHIEELLKQKVQSQSWIEKLEIINMDNSKELEKVRLLYNHLLQQLIKFEAQKESIVKKMKISSVEEMKYCWVFERNQMENTQNQLKLGDKEKTHYIQEGIPQSQVSIQFDLHHQLQAQFNEEIEMNYELLPVCSQTLKYSLLHQLKQLKTSQTIPKNMCSNGRQSSNTSLYFKYSNNTFENKSQNSIHESHLSPSLKSTKSDPKFQIFCEQTEEQSCNWQQMLSFFLGGVWSGACMMWMIAN